MIIMVINLAFSFNKEILRFKIKNKIVYYTDRKWKLWIQCVPKDKKLIQRIKMSRNALPMALVQMFDLTPKEEEQYRTAKDDKELAEIVRYDAKSKGCLEVKAK